MTRATREDEATIAPARLDLIELMFFAYRDFVEDADRLLEDDGFGRAHHRVLYFVATRPGLTIAALLEILRITKQSLNRVLKDLVERGYVESRLGASDRRCRQLSATARGLALARRIAAVQSSRLSRACERMGPGADATARAFLESMLDEPRPRIVVPREDRRS